MVRAPAHVVQQPAGETRKDLRTFDVWVVHRFPEVRLDFGETRFTHLRPQADGVDPRPPAGHGACHGGAHAEAQPFFVRAPAAARAASATASSPAGVNA